MTISFRKLTHPTPLPPSPQSIMDAITNATGISYHLVRSRLRSDGVVVARMAASHLLSKLLHLDSQTIGKIIHRTQSAVNYQLRAAATRYQTDTRFKAVVDKVWSTST